MKDGQKYSPEYWVVHDKKSDDVFINTASKDKQTSIDIFIDDDSWDRWETYLEDDELIEVFHNDKDLETILIELSKVEEK